MVEQGLVSYLASKSGVAALVKDRIFPELAPEGTAFPYLTYQLISSLDPGRTLSGAGGCRVARVQLDCWGRGDREGYKVVKQLAEQIRLSTDGFGGTMGTFTVAEARVEDFRDGGESAAFGRGTKESRVGIDLVLWYYEDTPTL